MCAAYLRIAGDLRRRILRGEWPEGERMPTINALERELPVSRMTIVRAMRVLRERGLVVTRGKGGTVVAPGAASPRIGLLSRLRFDTPGHAEFTHRLTERVREALVNRGFWPIAFAESAPPYPDGVPSAALLDAVAHGTLDGVVDVSSSFPAWNAAQVEPLTVPAVHFGVYPAPHQVFYDIAAIVDFAVALIAGTGRRAVGLIGNLPPQRARLCAAQGRLGVTADPRWLVTDPAETSEAFGFRALHEIWRRPGRRPDAIFVSDDVIAQGVVQGALALRIAVPDELLIVCMGNDEIDRFYPCPVVRADLSLAALAASVTDRLADVIGERVEPGAAFLVTDYVVRPGDEAVLTRAASYARAETA